MWVVKCSIVSTFGLYNNVNPGDTCIGQYSFNFFKKNCMDKRLKYLIENCQIFSKSFKNIDKHRPLKNKNPGLRYHFLSKKAKQSWNYKGLPGPIFSTYLFLSPAPQNCHCFEFGMAVFCYIRDHKNSIENKNEQLTCIFVWLILNLWLSFTSLG